MYQIHDMTRLRYLMRKIEGGISSLNFADMSLSYSLSDMAELPVTEWTVESVKLIYTQHKLRLEWAFLFGNSRGRYYAWRATSVNATSFVCEKTESIRPKGHCVVVRVTIEDPDDGFKPNGGKVQELSFKRKLNVWAYFFVKVHKIQVQGIVAAKVDEIKGSHNWMI
ncbi:acetyl-CoA carboxylase 1-like protein [Tanacetum coccineum]